ncbi:MAG: T9SS type A sorting domain-containing protein [Bacteroidota bacterium]
MKTRIFSFPGKESSIIILITLFLLQTVQAGAQWSTDPNTNTTVCQLQVQPFRPETVTDGEGGVIVAWLSSNSDIYAQRLDSSGVALWQTNGVVVCDEPSWQAQLKMVPDGTGGAILSWVDFRNTVDGDLFAQRIDKDGHRLWATNGVAVAAAYGDQQDAVMAPDENGGAIIAWIDRRTNTYLNKNVLISRISSSGTPLWGGSGGYVNVSDTINPKEDLSIFSDGSGGAFLTWNDRRTTPAVYAQHITSGGGAAWHTRGVRVFSDNTSYVENPVCTSDGEGGLIVSWIDNRNFTNGSNNYDVFAQRVSSDGSRVWNVAGVPVCTAAKDQLNPLIVPDGKGGAIIGWRDYRNYTNSYVQRISKTGQVRWQANGLSVLNKCGAITMMPDNQGGIILATQDDDLVQNALFAQHVDSSGNYLWTAYGSRFCSNQRMKTVPWIISDQRKGSIITWADTRNSDNNSTYSVFAQRLLKNGNLAGTKVLANQTILFDSIPAQRYSGGFFFLYATASSGLPVSYTSSDESVVSVSGNMLSINNVGTCTITAHQGGDANNNPAPDVSRTVVINKGFQYISFDEIGEKVLGDPPFDVNATASSLLPVQYFTNSEIVSLNGATVSMLEAGSAMIKAVQEGNEQYEPSDTAVLIFCIDPKKPQINNEAGTTLLVSNSLTGNQWYTDGSLMEGETNDSLYVTEPASYSVRVRADNCYSEMSDAINPFSTAVFNLQTANRLKVYPNPVFSELNIELPEANGQILYRINISDMSGRTVIDQYISGTTTLNLSELKPSVYILKVVYGNESFVERIVKK